MASDPPKAAMALNPRLIKESFAVVEGQGGIVIEYFYAHLFAHHPELRWMFPISMSDQRDRLFHALALVAQQIDSPDALAPTLGQLGRDHRKFDVLPEHYEAVGASLLATLEAFAGDAWTPEVAAAWMAAYGLAAETMRAAAAEMDAKAPRYWHAEVVAHKRPTWDIAVLTLKPRSALGYTPGQYVTVETPQWPRLWRPYSIANAPRADGTIDLHVRQVDSGQVSWALVDEVRPGDILKVGPPVGSMVLTESPCDLVFIAGGTGLAPLKALVEQSAQQGDQRAVHLFVGARHPTYLYDLPALRALEEANSWLAVKPVVSDDPDYAGLRGQVGEVAATYRSWIGHEVYVCGPRGMVAATRRALAKVGVADVRIHSEVIQAEVASESAEGRPASPAHSDGSSGSEPLPSRAAARKVARVAAARDLAPLSVPRQSPPVQHEWNGSPEEDPNVRLARIRDMIDLRRQMRIMTPRPKVAVDRSSHSRPATHRRRTED